MDNRMTREEIISLVSLVHRHNQLFTRIVSEEGRNDLAMAEHLKDEMAEADRDLIKKWGIRPCHGLPLWQPMIPT
ncbi:hypothetical protein ACWQV9_14100 [Brevundimonas diminuta]